MTKLRRLKKRRQLEALQRVIDASERMGLYDLEIADISHLWSRHRLPVGTAVAPMTRVMLQLAADCELPEYVVKPSFYRLGYCTADVPIDRIEELRKHQDVRGLSLPTERCQVRPARGEQ